MADLMQAAMYLSSAIANTRAALDTMPNSIYRTGAHLASPIIVLRQWRNLIDTELGSIVAADAEEYVVDG